MIDNQIIDQVRRANNIVHVVQDYIPLKKAGSNWRGLCPFHQDTNPSLNVSETKQIFKCFACGKGGNVFTFLQEYEKIGFIEAVRKLATRAGIMLPDYRPTKRINTRRNQLLQIYQTARDFFAENLFRYGEKALAYLKNRQFSPETAKNLELGFALNGEKALLNHLMKEGHSVDILKESGLFGNYSGNLVDLFRNRLMFPIHNSSGDVIAFGGRVMDAKAPGGKYVNSPSTELYTKGRELYGFYKTKYDIHKVDQVLICEGYFDFLRLYEYGFTTCVATLGTALTNEQIQLLYPYTKKVYMLYDADEAGIRNAIRASALCLGRQMYPYVVELPEGEDPDSFLLAHGKEELQALIDKAPSLIQYMAKSTTVSPDAAERIDFLLDNIRQMSDEVRQELALQEVSEAFKISVSALSKKLTSTMRRSYQTEEKEPLHAFSSIENHHEERNLLVISMQNVDDYKRLVSEVKDDYFINESYRGIFKWLRENVKPEAIESSSTLLDDIEDTQLRDALADLMFEEMQDLSFDDALKQVRIRKLQLDLEEMDRKLLNEPQNLDLFKQKQALSKEYKQLTRKVVHKIRF